MVNSWEEVAPTGSGPVAKLGCLRVFLRNHFVADNIVFGMEVLAHHPKELSLEIWEFTNFIYKA